MRIHSFTQWMLIALCIKATSGYYPFDWPVTHHNCWHYTNKPAPYTKGKTLCTGSSESSKSWDTKTETFAPMVETGQCGADCNKVIYLGAIYGTDVNKVPFAKECFIVEVTIIDESVSYKFGLNCPNREDSKLICKAGIFEAPEYDGYYFFKLRVPKSLKFLSNDNLTLKVKVAADCYNLAFAYFTIVDPSEWDKGRVIHQFPGPGRPPANLKAGEERYSDAKREVLVPDHPSFWPEVETLFEDDQKIGSVRGKRDNGKNPPIEAVVTFI